MGNGQAKLCTSTRTCVLYSWRPGAIDFSFASRSRRITLPDLFCPPPSRVRASKKTCRLHLLSGRCAAARPMPRPRRRAGHRRTSRCCRPRAWATSRRWPSWCAGCTTRTGSPPPCSPTPAPTPPRSAPSSRPCRWPSAPRRVPPGRRLLHTGIRVLRPQDVQLQLLLERLILLRLHRRTRQAEPRHQIKAGNARFSRGLTRSSSSFFLPFPLAAAAGGGGCECSDGAAGVGCSGGAMAADGY